MNKRGQQIYGNTGKKKTTAKGKRNAAIMKHRALWGYNRYEVPRGMWKGVMVPGLTFGNAIVCLNSGIQSGLDGNQSSVGRLALGAHGKTANEATQGDMGWTSFEVREAQSKIDHEERLRNMEEYGIWKYATGIVSNMARKKFKRKVKEAETV